MNWSPHYIQERGLSLLKLHPCLCPSVPVREGPDTPTDSRSSRRRLLQYRYTPICRQGAHLPFILLSFNLWLLGTAACTASLFCLKLRPLTTSEIWNAAWSGCENILWTAAANLFVFCALFLSLSLFLSLLNSPIAILLPCPPLS